ncbi:HAMP domain-containing histidine kinase [Apibacter muscae]|uniref:HAMP domain-containing sensor histidine kinase n=1 Tax=Apibacter muscae TaxID=2509004 RepID=UPI0011ABB32B|nr:HAMP domain-containing sensor histidine kinase [Apibacter muscae]TWP23828.1 HAMP domain-containing histidine kinase [Apibacter muscae]
MKIRNRLTLLFTFISVSILIFFSVIIYFTAKKNRSKEFYELLTKEAITKFNLFVDAKVPPQILQNIYYNNSQIIDEVEVAIYDENYTLVYHDAIDIDFVKETRSMLDKIKVKGELKFYQDQWQVIGLKHKFKNKTYIITAAAYDQFGYKELHLLLKNSIFLIVVSIFFIYLTGYYFVKRIFQPITEMTDNINEISANRLDYRLKINKNKDELTKLAQTFNQMLDRLENSFDSQKKFVSNISHEIRTPLAAIITEIEIALQRENTIEDYQTTLHKAWMDANKIVKLSNNLLDFAKASYDPSQIAFKPVRIDEILLDSCEQVKRINNNYRINLSFENEFHEENEIHVNGNEYLLKVAFANLIENGCKFSQDHKTQVSILVVNSKIEIRFKDEGIGISRQELKKIFKPFYRGNNKEWAQGSGIGLSLADKIIKLHGGEIIVSSKINLGTTFTVILSHL